MKYQIIYADPPWHFKNHNDQTASRWVGNHYSVMALSDIACLPVQDIADKNCALFIWTTAPFIPQALEVIRAWGFAYKTKAFCWVKQNKSGIGIFTGMGYWTRSNSEDCWIATRGNPRRIDASVQQVLISPIQKHSCKPPEARNRIVQLMGDLPRIELFAREKVDGWDCWGDEIDSDIVFAQISNKKVRE